MLIFLRLDLKFAVAFFISLSRCLRHFIWKINGYIHRESMLRLKVFKLWQLTLQDLAEFARMSWIKSTNVRTAITKSSPNFWPKSSRQIKFYSSFSLFPYYSSILFLYFVMHKVILSSLSFYTSQRKLIWNRRTTFSELLHKEPLTFMPLNV